jgi:hypothetical protein
VDIARHIRSRPQGPASALENPGAKIDKEKTIGGK